MLMPFWQDWFSETGYVPRSVNAIYFGEESTPLGSILIPRINVFANIVDPRIGFAVFLLIVVAAILTTIGLWTRVSSALLAIGVISLSQRCGPILHGGDTVMRIMLIYIAVGPSGAALSVDRWLAAKKGKPAVRISMWPLRLIAFNTALVYFTTTWLKLYGNTWRNGTATWYPARLHEFDRFPVPGFVNEFPMVTLTTYGTITVEFLLGTLVFVKPLRKYILGAGLLMHAYIEYSMNIPLFAFMMCACYICFYEGEEVEGWLQRVRARVLPSRA
ncbi:MAG: HTTM domain-containing protein [Fimbriimonas sp.]